MKELVGVSFHLAGEDPVELVIEVDGVVNLRWRGIVGPVNHCGLPHEADT